MVRCRPDVFVALVVVLTLVVTGPVVGVDVTRTSPSTFGEGTASVASVDVETQTLRITAGRFGTGVDYLRVPPAEVTVATVSGRPRLVYTVDVPKLGLQLTDTAVVTSPSTYRLDPNHRGIERKDRPSTYEATILVRVQSFTRSNTVVSENVTIEVIP